MNDVSLSLEGLKVDDSEAKKEASDWERRRARVTAALVPGLKKCLAPGIGATWLVSLSQQVPDQRSFRKAKTSKTEIQLV